MVFFTKFNQFVNNIFNHPYSNTNNVAGVVCGYDAGNTKNGDIQNSESGDDYDTCRNGSIGVDGGEGLTHEASIPIQEYATAATDTDHILDRGSDYDEDDEFDPCLSLNHESSVIICPTNHDSNINNKIYHKVDGVITCFQKKF